MKTQLTQQTDSPDPPAEPGPDLPPPSRPVPGSPKPGDPPGQPSPGDLPPSKPAPDSPGPIRPQTLLALLLLSLLADTTFAQDQPLQKIDDNDIDIKQAVEDALLYDPRIRSAKIEVRARQGAASLIGNVSSLAAKQAAERDAKNTLGVRRVINNLKVKIVDCPGVLEDPTNRVVSVFDDHDQAEAAHKSLIQEGFDDNEVRLLHGAEAADNVDTSAKWFADTDAEIKRYQRELQAGNTVLSVPVEDSGCREKVHDILKRHDARLVTDFGQWITEMMK